MTRAEHLDYSREQFPLFADALTEAYTRRLAAGFTGRIPVAVLVAASGVGLVAGFAAGFLIARRQGGALWIAV